MKSDNPCCKAALHIVKTLHDKGFIAYYAGGCVRDMLMGIESKDIDIATDASPAEIMKLFPKSISVGAQFGVIVVVHNGIQFEVATFRQESEYYDGRHPSKITSATPEEDAQRRDFTVNGIFFDPIENKIYDYVNGQIDIEKRLIKSIGNPFERFKEDRLRMMRAVRFACRFIYSIEHNTESAILEMAPELFPSVSIERVEQELSKMIKDGNFKSAILQLDYFGLWSVIFPEANFDLEERSAHFDKIDKKNPLVIYLLELFYDRSLDFMKDLSYRLKLSNVSRKYIDAYYQIQLCDNGTDLATWARLYANGYTQACLDVLGVRLGSDYRHKHRQRLYNLLQHVERLVQKKPVLTSRDLMNLGVSAGKGLGVLLRLAEDISINKNIDDKNELFKLLELTPEWIKYGKN